MNKFLFILLALAIAGFFFYGSRNNHLTFSEIQPLEKILLDRRESFIREKLKYPKENFREKEDKLKNLKAELAEFEKKIANLQPQVQNLEKQLADKDKNYSDYQSASYDIDVKIQKLEREKNECS